MPKVQYILICTSFRADVCKSVDVCKATKTYPITTVIPEFTSTWVCNTCGTGRRNSYSLLHYKEDNLLDAYNRDIYHYKVAADLHQGLIELTNDLEEESNRGLFS